MTQKKLTTEDHPELHDLHYHIVKTTVDFAAAHDLNPVVVAMLFANMTGEFLAFADTHVPPKDNGEARRENVNKNIESGYQNYRNEHKVKTQ